jgi:HSP20 family protein
MYLTKWHPRGTLFDSGDLFAELKGLRRMFDQPLEAFFGEPGLRLFEGEGMWRPAMDLAETKDAFVVKAEVPGVKAEDIQIGLDGNTLTVAGERKQETSVEEEGYSRIERSYGKFERSVLLPPTVDAEGIKATYANGVLEVRLPKKEEAKPKRIPVQTA